MSTNLGLQEKFDILLSVMLLFCSDSEKRDANNIISDATLDLQRRGRSEMTPDKAAEFFTFLEEEMRKRNPDFEWPDKDWVCQWHK